jgi:hypothetical protein
MSASLNATPWLRPIVLAELAPGGGVPHGQVQRRPGPAEAARGHLQPGGAEPGVGHVEAAPDLARAPRPPATRQPSNTSTALPYPRCDTLR